MTTVLQGHYMSKMGLNNVLQCVSVCIRALRNPDNNSDLLSSNILLYTLNFDEQLHLQRFTAAMFITVTNNVICNLIGQSSVRVVNTNHPRSMWQHSLALISHDFAKDNYLEVHDPLWRSDVKTLLWKFSLSITSADG